MSISLYDASVPVFARGLAQLAHVLEKGADHASASGIDPQQLVGARLAPDMFTLAGQVQCTTDAAKAAVARLAGIAIPPFPDDETTFEQLQQRITQTQDFLRSVQRGQIDGGEARAIEITKHGLHFNGQQYLLQFVLPNFFFHLSVAYAVLRANGVALSKRDFRGNF